MSTTHGNDGLVYIGANGVAEVTAFTYNETMALTDDSACGDTEETYLEDGKKVGSGSVNCHWDPSDSTGQEALTAGASVALKLYPQGNASGDVFYEGTVKVESTDLGVDKGSINSRSFSYKGVLTRASV